MDEERRPGAIEALEQRAGALDLGRAPEGRGREAQPDGAAAQERVDLVGVGLVDCDGAPHYPDAAGLARATAALLRAPAEAVA
jgi:hypothetical protein